MLCMQLQQEGCLVSWEGRGCGEVSCNLPVTSAQFVVPQAKYRGHH